MRQVTRALPYMWLCGGVSVNHDLLSRFRVEHGGAAVATESEFEGEDDDYATRVQYGLCGTSSSHVTRSGEAPLGVKSDTGTTFFQYRG